jgi:nucleoid-associated protein YgaU
VFLSHGRSALLILFVYAVLISACSSPGPVWRTKASVLVDDVTHQQAAVLFPQDYNSLLESFEHGEAVLHVQADGQEADSLYLLAIQKGTLLKARLREQRLLKAEEERLRVAAEAARLEEERLMIQAAEAEERLREQERIRSAQDAQAAEAARGGALAREMQAVTHTVRRGETLPQIAARSEVYNDASLWPIIYRANRDQIRDPKQLWPGQVLKIPRHFTRDEAKEAKKFSGKK